MTKTVQEAFSSLLIINYMTEETVFHFLRFTKVLSGNPAVYSYGLIGNYSMRYLYNK